MARGKPLHTIGWREYVDLPEWKVRGIRAKIDTGARTSAIDVADIEHLPGRKVRFHVVLSRNNRQRRKAVTARIVRESTVRSSLGKHESRIVVRTLARVGDVEREIELSLVCRKSLLCRMLLGRSALAGAFCVDPQHTYLYTRKPKRKKAKKKKKPQA